MPKNLVSQSQLEYQRGDGQFEPLPASAAGVASVFGRTGTITAQSGDYTAGQVGATAILSYVAITAAASPYSAAANTVVDVDTTLGNVTVELPSGPAAGTLVAVKQVILGTGNTVTVACQGSDVINRPGGGTTASLTLASQGSLLHYSGPTAGIWTILADDLPLSQVESLISTMATSILTRGAVVTYSASPYSAAADSIVPVDTTGGTPVVVDLPAAPAAGAIVVVKMIAQASTNSVTVSCSGSDVYNKTSGSTSLSLTLLNQGVILQYSGAANGAVWTDISDDLPLTQLNGLYDAAGAAATAQATAETYALNLQPTSGSPLATTKGGWGASYASVAAGLAAAGVTPGAASESQGSATPASTVSTSLVMLGLAETIPLSGSGKVLAILSGSAMNTTSGINGTMGARYGIAVATTVAAGSNGGEISQIATWGGSFGGNGVLDVASIPSWAPTSGTLYVAASGSTTAVVTYTGISGNTFTGCTYVSGSATGTVATGGAVTTVPPNGAAVTGTRWGGAADQAVHSGAATSGSAFIFQQVLILAAGTTYWFDGCQSVASNTGSVPTVAVTLIELPF